MTTNESSKSKFLLTMGSILVVSIVLATVFKSVDEADHNDYLSEFNQHLVAYNQELHHADRLTRSHEPPNSDSPDLDVKSDEIRTASNTERTETPQNNRSNIIKPYVGELDATNESPAFDWLDPHLSIDAIVDASEFRRADESVYGWLQLRSDVKASELQKLTKQLGVEVVSSNPKYIRVKLPLDRDMLTQLAALPEVEGFGLMPSAAKSPPHLMDAFDSHSYETEVPIFITTMNKDVDGSMKQRLIAMGATIGRWEPDILTYFANVDRVTLDQVLAADFVEKVSPNALLRAHLEDLTGAMGTDLHRNFVEVGHVWSGEAGGGATVGVMDTGINKLHREFSDKSVCTRSTAPVSPTEDINARIDPNGHGSHVSGIATASGITDPAFAGVAPGVKSLRVAKVLNNSGGGDTLMFFNGVNFHMETDPCSDPATATPAPVINVSLGGYTPETDGTSILSRKMDGASYNFRQNFVISAGNSGALGPGDTPATKSAMSVGATTDSGVIASFSSHGPTEDGRLLPKIVAPGFLVTSAAGGGAKADYTINSGTSMSAPAVTGLAGVLIGANPELANNPAAVRASLMAAAIKPRRWVGSRENIPTSNTRGPGDIQNEYGMGFASLVPHGLDGVNHGVIHGEMNSDDMASTMITVPEGTARLDIVLAFNEPASPALNRTVLSNIDLYLDRHANCGGGACGEYSSKSEIDTVEWILIKDPAPGDYELKVLPANAFDSPVLFGAAWVMIEDDVPELSITSEVNSVSLDSGDRLEVDLKIGASSFVANAVTVHVMCRAKLTPAKEEGQEDVNPCDAYEADTVGWLPGSFSSRADGSYASHAPNDFSAPIQVGAVNAESTKDLTLRLSGSAVSEVGSHTLYFVATSWNGMSDYHAVTVVVDGDVDLPPRAIPPANDDIDNATALTGDGGVLQPDLILATREGGEPMLRDTFAVSLVKLPISSEDNLNYAESLEYEYARHNSVWYAVDAPPGNPTLLALDEIPGNVGVNIYKGSAAKSALVADNWNTASSDGADSAVYANLEPDSRYYVQVYAHDDVGEVAIHWATGEPKAPENDHFAAAKVIQGDTGRVNGTNFKASLETFETYDSMFDFSTWYSWSPDSDGAFRFQVDGQARIAVLRGSNPRELQRVSTVPDDGDHIYAAASKDETYTIVVLSAVSQNTLKGYWLEWGKVAKMEDHASNDMFAMAEEAIESILDDWSLGRTVEPGEPTESGVGSRWWKWTAPASGNFTFTSDGVAGDTVSVFSGSDLAGLRLLGSGPEFVVNVEEDSEYYISIGRSLSQMFIDFLGADISASVVTWGPTPANDSRSGAIQLTGASSNVDFTHAFATLEETDGLLIGMGNSLWWEWTAPESGWHQFATTSNPSLSSFSRSVDSVVIVFDGNTGRRIGTSDRSYLLNGNSEITFYAEAGTAYMIQSVLRASRSRDPLGETTLSWGPASAPPYSRFVGRYLDAAMDSAHEIEALENPTSIATNEGGGKIFVNAASGMVVFDAVDVDTMPVMSNTVSYVDATGASLKGIDDALLYWDQTMNALYAIAPDTIWLANGYNSPNGHFVSCGTSGSNYGEITDAFTTSDGRFLYVLGLVPLPEDVEPIPFFGPFPGYEISIFNRSDTNACELSHVKSVDMDSISALENTFSFAASADSSHVYLAGDDGVTTLSRHATTGDLTEVGFASAFQRAGFSSWWRESEAVLAPLTNSHLFITAEDSPTVAVYSLTDPANPLLIDSKAGYYARLPGSTFEESPVFRFGCRIIGGHAASISVDFMCRGELLTAELQESGDLFLMDAMYQYQTDRFGRTLSQVQFAPDGLKTVGVRPLSQNLFILNSDVVDSFAVFDHVIQIEGNPYE